MRRRPTRPGSFRGVWFAFLGSALLLAFLLGLLFWNPGEWPAAGRGEPLVVFCAASQRAPVEAVARQYRQEFGVPVELQYGGSETLLTSIDVARRGDLYLPADDSYLDGARSRGLVAETLPLADMTAVVAVPVGNPKGIRSLDDLLRADVRLAQANPDAAAVGKLTRAALRKTGRWAGLAEHTVVFKPTVNDVANDVKVGTADAGVVWDATVRQYPGLEPVADADLAGVTAHVGVGVLTCSTQPTAALRFARYLASRDRGLKEFERQGFKVVDGDAWAVHPELHLLAGAMLRPAIQETVVDFEQREGVHVTTVYNGCGILVAQMRAGEHPDAYFACDRSFMTQVNDLFLDSVDVSTNQLVILVPKGNPHDVHTLQDLGRSGLRVGVGHEKQCALGVLTQRTLDQGGVLEPVMKNVVTRLPTGDMLVNDLRTGALDAVVAYVSNAASAGDKFEAIPIDVPCALATQPIAVGKSSPYKYLTGRLLEAIRSRQSRERFEANGFHWQAAR
jgi:molybdenum ABC transporter molybdate-binding protein